MTAGDEKPISFACRGSSLIGMVHPTKEPARRGVLIVVGGPQYRLGSHRQFLLLARALAAAGIPAMRFDYRGMGDSEGEFAGFEHIDDDIAAAIDAFIADQPGLQEIVLWGLCDAASAILFYAHRDPRISGLVLLNPWVRTDSGLARAQMKHYYAARILDPALWRKIIRGQFHPLQALRSLAATLRAAFGGGDSTPDTTNTPALPERMAQALARFAGPVLLIISGQDLTAREFDDAAAASTLWRRLLAGDNVMRVELADADHTFSRRQWRDRVAEATIAWVDEQGR
jgi:uncharacterized protein